MMNRQLFFCGLICLRCVLLHAQDPAALVNPFIGTANSGNTNPGAVCPWGMVSVSPFNTCDTIGRGSAASPYYSGKPYIYGFTHLNMSGLGCADMGTFCLMPVTGKLVANTVYRSTYSAEKASPGYYSVMLDSYHVRAELSATPRTAIGCYIFPQGESHILLNLAMGLTSKRGGMIKRVSATEMEGFKNIGNICGLKTLQTVYFVMKVSKTPVQSGIWDSDGLYNNFELERSGDSIGAFLSFQTTAGEKVCVKVGISYVSIQNARENLAAEQPGFDFKTIQQTAYAQWKEALSKIQVEGGSENDRIKFYTALYHTLLHPNIFSDVNGQYRVFENSKKAVAAGDRYTVFSLWDTYRCLHPFLSLVYPARASAMIRSLMGMAAESGFLPRWEYAGIESGAMTGDPALVVITDTWLRGIHDFDIEKAYAAMRHNALTPEKDNYMRPGMNNWLQLGYIPDDAPNVLHPFGGPATSANDYASMRERHIVWGPVSTGLEYCISDWNLAQLALQLGKTDDYHLFYKRSMLYKNSFDSSAGFMRSKRLDGAWASPFDPSNNKTNAFTEGSSWNYSFMVPHDIPGLIALMGGPQRFTDKLDSCFRKQYFDITNEPDMAYPYLYNYVKGKEWKTQQRVHEIITRSFTNTPGGLPGNDDCGALSSWLVFSMMGFYPACPGDLHYQLTTPSFNKITIMTDTTYYAAKEIVITAANMKPDSYFIRSIRFNNKLLKTTTIHHGVITCGGTLAFDVKTKNQHE